MIGCARLARAAALAFTRFGAPDASTGETGPLFRPPFRLLSRLLDWLPDRLPGRLPDRLLPLDADERLDEFTSAAA